MAQDKVHSDGYNYKKGKSWSKCTLTSSSNPDSTKRTKIDTQEREARIGDILEQISDIDKRITFKQRRIETATATRNFKTCDELSEEISELSQRRELNWRPPVKEDILTLPGGNRDFAGKTMHFN
jgi:hypothetical protein